MGFWKKVQEVEGDLLRDAHGISKDVLGWLHDMRDQLAFANQLYAEAVAEAGTKIADLEKVVEGLKARQSEAFSAISANQHVLSQVATILPPVVQAATTSVSSADVTPSADS